ASLRRPNSIPTGVSISRSGVCPLLFGNQRIPLRAERVDLENIGIAMIVGRINDDFKVIIEFLADISPQLSGNDAGGVGVEAGDSKEPGAPGVEDTHLRSLRRLLSLKGFSLQESPNWSRLPPKRIVKGAVQTWSAIYTKRLCCAERCLRLG